jgi:hypothetical protein
MNTYKPVNMIHSPRTHSAPSPFSCFPKMGGARDRARLFVPPLIRERITNTCDETCFIKMFISTLFVPGNLRNECLFLKYSSPDPKMLGSIFFCFPPFKFLKTIRSINHDSINNSSLLVLQTLSSHTNVICRTSEQLFVPQKKTQTNPLRLTSPHPIRHYHDPSLFDYSTNWLLDYSPSTFFHMVKSFRLNFRSVPHENCRGLRSCGLST